ncbi:MAG TPA: phosphate ABC transporter ATP-binding protein [Candidatus Anaerofilum excrementigallinarum]|nr:phosphate ABC transporter ATP-binding protein [Candidatus Anaerofilum excrementigallinarum]
MESTAILQTNQLKLYYGDFQALKGIDMLIPERQITAFIGPSGCGKSTFLKTLNRMNDLVPGVRIEGQVLYNGQDIFDKDVDVTWLRKKIGMVFQKPNPFPMSIYDNIAYGPRLHGTHSKAELDLLVEKSLRGAALWDEVKDRLKKSALGLSGGQQQRMCIARALAVEPDVLLMDEPTSALDPASTMRIEELMSELKDKYTVVIVTHNMQQAARISDKCAFFLLGELIEFGDTDQVFNLPRDKRTEDYISGRFG